MARSILISLGKKETKRRKEALNKLAQKLGYEYLSELFQELADLADSDLEKAADICQQIKSK